MIENKYKGQRTDTKEWVYGQYIMLIEGIRRNHCIIVDNTHNCGILESPQIKFYVIPETVEHIR